jgi:hypothetical protein
MHWSILCDFDGTISLEDVIDSLLKVRPAGLAGTGRPVEGGKDRLA